MGWTGGQYSLYRVALAVTAACAVAAVAAPSEIASTFAASSPRFGAILFAVTLAAALALALGFRDRVAACILVPLVGGAELFASGVIAIPSWTGLLTERAGLVLTVLLVLHVCTPRAPFGAFDARERVDPRGGWQRPGWMTEIGWTLLVVVTAAALFVADDSQSSIGRLTRHAPELAAALVGLLARSARPVAWSVLVLWHLAGVFAFGAPGGEASRLLLIVFAAEPGWWSGRSLHARSASDPVPARLFYDGDCGFCHRSVRFILSEEVATPAGLRPRFAPLGSVTFAERLAKHPELDPATLPDSIVLELEDGAILTRSAAALEIASRLGGFWRFVALIGSRLPRRLLDAGYDAIARVRKQLFAQPKDACPILPAELRTRFDA
jgi:predicted DCC family thiol-disulfide oxidoreductase YuxK